MTCENCGKEHDGSYGSGRFCSDHCRRSYCVLHRKKLPSKEELQKRKFGNKQAPYGTWKCNRCNVIFSTRAQLIKHNHQIHPINGNWNKGLTKKTDIRIKQAAQKFHDNYVAGKFSLGGWKQSNIARQKISNAKVKNHDIYGGFKHVKWYKIKNIKGVEYTVRGKWELNVAKRLNNLGLLWQKNKWISYLTNDNIIHHYNPDFYLPVTNEFIEVKGYYSIKDQSKMNFVLQSNPTLKIFLLTKQAYEDFCFNNKNLISQMLINMSTCQNSYRTLS